MQKEDQTLANPNSLKIYENKMSEPQKTESSTPKKQYCFILPHLNLKEPPINSCNWDERNAKNISKRQTQNSIQIFFQCKTQQ